MIINILTVKQIIISCARRMEKLTGVKTLIREKDTNIKWSDWDSHYTDGTRDMI